MGKWEGQCNETQQPLSLSWTGWITVFLWPLWKAMGESDSKRGHSHGVGRVHKSLFPESTILYSKHIIKRCLLIKLQSGN